MGLNTASKLRYSHSSVLLGRGEAGLNRVVYRELSSLEADLGYSAKALYTLSNSVCAHYKSVRIPKNSEGYRQLLIPDDFLKAVQRRIAERLLLFEAVSPYATAYRPGGSTLINASVHVGKRTLLKLDIFHFFDGIIYPLVKEKVFPTETYAEHLRILLTLLCMYRDVLPQGAPTSPAISNIIMRDFDDAVGTWCQQRRISYTRYCDDMTFSGDFAPEPVIDLVRAELRKLGLLLNERKTTVVYKGQRKIVTGIVVNEKVNIAAAYKRQIRQEMYYCMKYGIASHMEKCRIAGTTVTYIQKMLGKINYALSVCRSDELIRYREWLRREQQSAGAFREE